jgi:uncharacterized membrane protein HdeD (DUF308 family)
MSTIVQQAEQLADDRLKKVRWALGLSGLLAIVFAIVILVWPSISLFALVILFGAFALARGIIGLGTAISSPIKEGRAGGSCLRAWPASPSAWPSFSSRTCPHWLCST